MATVRGSHGCCWLLQSVYAHSGARRVPVLALYANHVNTAFTSALPSSACAWWCRRRHQPHKCHSSKSSLPPRLLRGGQRIGYCLTLNTIHQVVRSDEPFGVHVMFLRTDIPLRAFPGPMVSDWFKPTGDCGIDSPIVPNDVTLSGYSNGWSISMLTAGISASLTLHTIWLKPVWLRSEQFC